MVVAAAAPAPRVPQTPSVPEGWRAVWDTDEQDWYFYHPRTRHAQWESPTANPPKTVRRCGFRRILPAFMFPKLPAPPKSRAHVLPSESTLQAIDKIDRDFNDEEIAMVLQHEEFSQDLSGRHHSFDQHWIDTADFNEAGPSTRAAQATAVLGNATIPRPSQPRPKKNGKQQDLPAVCQQRECGICMDDEDDEGDAEWTWLQCTHQFHTACIEDWLKTANRCPVCRTDCA